MNEIHQFPLGECMEIAIECSYPSIRYNQINNWFDSLSVQTDCGLDSILFLDLSVDGIFQGIHVHLLLRTGTIPIATVMRRLLTGYAVRFNRRHGRHGHLFQNMSLDTFPYGHSGHDHRSGHILLFPSRSGVETQCIASLQGEGRYKHGRNDDHGRHSALRRIWSKGMLSKLWGMTLNGCWVGWPIYAGLPQGSCWLAESNGILFRPKACYAIGGLGNLGWPPSGYRKNWTFLNPRRANPGWEAGQSSKKNAWGE